jgi:large subunit ribosomal protein L6
MKKEFFSEIEIPEGVEANIEDSTLSVKGPEGENKRTFNTHKLEFAKKDSKIVIGNKKATKVEKKMTNTISAHIKNMIKGVQEKFEYKLKVVFSHFPITAEVQGNKIIIKNFLGEKIPRECSIPEGAEVKIEKDIITVSSIDKETAGQAAANLESVTKIRMRDRRVFQDGIYIINKAGREL